MIKRIGLILCLLALPASAQMNTGMDKSVSASSFSGPGDVVSGATAWWGLRAYSKSYASSLGKLAVICTAADAACADVKSDANGNFNLAGTPSLTCNNGANICTVKTLYDQSGANSCSGACDATQATGSNRPILVVPGAANGCPSTSDYCMNTGVGNSTQLLRVGSTIASAIPQPYTVSIVYDNPSRTGDEYLMITSFTFPGYVSGFTGANIFAIVNLTTNATQTVSDNAFHALQAVANTTSSDINVDGTQHTTTVGTAVNFPAGNIVLFNIDGGTTSSFGGFVTEIGLWPQLFTPTNSSNMSSNQHSYWGF